jgi:hypothetical protein
MGEVGRVCRGHADLIRAILVNISHLNKLPLLISTQMSKPQSLAA